MVTTQYKRDAAEILALKEEGHDLIDRIAKRRHITKNQVYRILQNKLGSSLPEYAHFGNMHTLRDVKKAVETLRIIYQPKPQKPVKPKAPREDILPLREQRRLLRKPWWKKALIVIHRWWKNAIKQYLDMG